MPGRNRAATKNAAKRESGNDKMGNGRNGRGTAAGRLRRDRRPRLGEGECNADGVQGMIGQKATAESGAELLAKTGARTLRWVPPRTAVTMDFRSDRLTVSYDDDMVIERVSCG